MEAVLKNVGRTAELLAIVQTERVKEWDRETLDRAFQWSRYCEHLYSKFNTNPSISKALERQLQATNDSLRATFQGYTDVTFADLSRCEYLLLSGLLKNPALPSSLLKLLFDTSDSPWKSTASEGSAGQSIRLIEYASACKVLGAVCGPGHTCPAAEVQGAMLMGRLDTLLGIGSREELGLAEEFLDSVLQTCGEHDSLPKAIAAAALSRKNKTSDNVSGTSEDFLLDWLLKHNRLLHSMCSSLPVELLIDIARQSMKFRVVYCNILKEWASHVEYDINEGEWVQASASGMPFKTLTHHFRSLLEACPSLKEDTMKELHALRAADGDFDVRGLSVWGDLLSELQ